MGSGRQGKPRVLIADDDDTVRSVFARLLTVRDYSVTVAADGATAARLVQSAPFDVIVSDIAMPGLSGVELLRRVREHDLDVPVILVTGDPDIDTAMSAVQYGALRYLKKPVPPAEFLEVIEYALHIHELAKTRRDALSLLGVEAPGVGDRAGLEHVFDRTVSSIFMAYQPIIQRSARGIFAYEALLRSSDEALSNPAAILDVAERLNTVHRLGRKIREQVAESISSLPDGVSIFVNLHPWELTDEELFQEGSPLARYAERVVLEITERARVEDSSDIKDRIAALRSLGYRFAIDDLGVGYAGLSSFVQLEPDVVKIDMSLVRDVDRDPRKSKLIRSLYDLCTDMGIGVVAEGVETREEQRALTEIGVDLLQGFVFAHPSAPFAAASEVQFD